MWPDLVDTNPHDPVPPTDQPQAPSQPPASGQPHESQQTQPSRRFPTPHAARTAAVVFLAVLVATAVFGIPAGYIWALVAPRALGQVVSRGAASVVNPETTAFIAADAWYALIAALGGLLTGVAGYLLAVRRRSAPAALGLILGGLGAAALMAWIGDNYGQAAFQHRLLTSPNGTYLRAALSLGSKSAILFWPVVAALVIAIPEAVVYFRTPSRSSTTNSNSPTSTNTTSTPDSPAQ